MSSNQRLVPPDRVKSLVFQTAKGGSVPAARDNLRLKKNAGGHSPENRDLNEIEREAFQKGFEAGEKSGMKMAEVKTEAALRRISESLQELVQLRRRILKESERDLVELALEIAKKLVYREIRIDEKIILTLVRVALEKLPSSRKVVLFVHPQDYPLLESELTSVVGEETDREIVLKVKEDLHRGECQVDSEYGSVDATLAEQFRELEQELLSGF